MEMINQLTKMTSRQRVRAALCHQEPDRVPIGLGGTIFTGIHVDEYLDISRYLGLGETPPKVYEQFQMLARFDEDMRARLHTDLIELENPSMTWGFKNDTWQEWTTFKGNRVLMPEAFQPEKDEKGSLYILDREGNRLACMPPDGLYFERTCETGMSDHVVKMDPDEWQRTLPVYTDSELRELEQKAKDLYESTTYSICGSFNRGQLSTYGIFAGQTITDWMCTLMTDEEYAYSILRITAEKALENLEMYLQAVGKYLDMIVISGFDFGIQDRELMKPEIFRDLFLPNFKLINDYVHSHSDAKTVYHSCGSIWNILEYFIAAGVDVLNPVQTTAAKMDPVKLKRNFGDRLTFLGGGIDTQTVLPYGTPEDVRKQVMERLRIFAPGGGFIFSPVHNTQYEVPPENFIAMIDTVLEYGGYPMT